MRRAHISPTPQAGGDKIPTTESFEHLAARVQGCRLCPRMEGRRRVLGRDNGNLHARIMFVAEAPGRLGADRSGIPLSGDRTGRNFATLLAEAGIERRDIFVTNAVLCNPRDSRGNNAPPSAKEIRNCASHLAATIDIIAPEIVVALGLAALRSLGLVCPHEAVLPRDVGTPIKWYGRTLIPLYHPGPRACMRRPLELQREDYRSLGLLARR